MAFSLREGKHCSRSECIQYNHFWHKIPLSSKILEGSESLGLHAGQKPPDRSTFGPPKLRRKLSPLFDHPVRLGR